MNPISVVSASVVTEVDLASVRLGPRFGRLDLQSRLAVAAVAALPVDLSGLAADRTGICLAASAGSLNTDVNFWQGRNAVGGPSPTLFAYTLPSAAVGEIAIHFRLTGPNRCFVGDDTIILPEAADLLRTGEADACVCVFCETAGKECAAYTGLPPGATACALLLKSGGEGRPWENDRDMKALCTLISAVNSAG